MAPELCQLGGGRTKETDIYAFGVVMYEVISGGYVGETDAPVHSYAHPGPHRGLVRPKDLQMSGFGKGTWGFIEQCLYGNPRQRPSAAMALQHFLDVSEGSVLVDPSPSSRVRSTDSESRLDRYYHGFWIISSADHDLSSLQTSGNPASDTYLPTTSSVQCSGFCC